MQRRKFIAGVGSLASAVAVGLGTGAVDSIRSNRDMTVDVAGDQAAYLAMDPGNSSQFVTEDSNNGTIGFDFGSDSGNGGSGVNNNAVTAARPAYTLKNQSNEALYTEVWNPFRNSDLSSQQNNTRSGGSSVTVPAGLDVQFIAVNGDPNSIGADEAALIDRDEAPSGFGNPVGDIPANAYIHNDPSYEKTHAGWATQFNPDKCGHIKLDAGEAVKVIVRVVADDVDVGGVNSTFGQINGPVYAEANSDSTHMTTTPATGSNMISQSQQS